MEPSRIRQQLGYLKKERNYLEYSLSRPYQMIPYCLVSLANICGKPLCRCKKGKPHGPYWYLSTKEKGKTKMIYLPKEKVEALAPLAQRYKEYQASLTRLRRLNQEIVQALIQIEKTAFIKPEKKIMKNEKQRR
jgi:hypothetical protein